MKILFIAKQYIKMAFQFIILPFVYWIYRKRPIEKKLVIFADAHHTTMPNSMEYLYKQLKSRPEYIVETHICDFAKESNGAVLKHMIQFMKRYAVAEYVFLCDNYLPISACNKRNDTKVFQLWHGCGAFKRFGYDTEQDIPKYYKGNVYKNYDVVTVSAPACISHFSSAMQLPEDHIKAIGVSRTDLYFDEEYNTCCREKFYQKYPEAIGKKIILWAPTFRGNAALPKLEGEEVIAKMKTQLEREGFYLITKLHPHMEDNYKLSNCGIPTEELLPVIDLLLTDYSSIFFEFLLFEKPIVFFVPDLAEYMVSRGFYLDYKDLPGIVVEEGLQLGDILKEQMKHYDIQKITRFREHYMASCDGHVTKRIMDSL